MDMGLIPRVSFGFEMKKYITQVDLNYNSAVNTTKYNNEIQKPKIINLFLFIESIAFFICIPPI